VNALMLCVHMGGETDGRGRAVSGRLDPHARARERERERERERAPAGRWGRASSKTGRARGRGLAQRGEWAERE
jgi:hypothetical protein